MAAKNFRSTLLEPTSEFAKGDRLRFTALSTSGSVFNSSFSEIAIGDNGQYSVDLQYGKYRIDYKPYEGCWQKFADVEVSARTLATSLQALALSSKPVTDDTILAMQSLLADAEAAKAAAEKAKAAAETALAGIDSTVADVEAGYPALLAAQLSKTVTVNASTGNDDASDGTSAKPYKTIKKAIESQPDTINLNIYLTGGTTKETAHIINQNISLGGRRVTIIPSGNHIILDDSINEVFFGDKGSSLFVSEIGSSAAHIHASTPKTLLYCNGESSLSFSTFHSSKIYLADAATFTLIKTRYYGDRGVSNLDASRLSIVTANGDAVTNAEVYAVDIDIAGAVLVNLWSCSLGTKFNYTRGWGIHSVINGSLVVVSN